MVASDIDGTLTVSRETTRIDPGVVEVLQLLERNGVSVVLVSSNTLPVVIGLKRYFDLSGPAIGESGALVYYGGNRIEHLTNYSTREAADYLEKEYSWCLHPSWQNQYRFHDYAFRVRDECKERIREVLDEIKRVFREKHPYVRVGYSGYAVHLTPMDVSKAGALRHVSERLGIPLEEFAAVGDSEMDADMVRTVGLGVAVGNADEELKRVADYVTEKPSGHGFVEFAMKLLRGDIYRQ